MKAHHWIAIGALWAAIAVGLGAAGAHGLRERLMEGGGGRLANWQTAVEYQMWHAFALIVVGILQRGRGGRFLTAWTFLLGSTCFSGSIYLLCFDVGRGVVWPLTPIGGTLLLAGWIAVAVQALRGSFHGAD